MPRLDLDLLHTFVVIADTGSLSAAAPLLCRSQSAVSEQIRKLEQVCGTQLLIRGKAGASPTLAGKRLLNHARDLLTLNDRAYRDMQGLQLAGELRLAITDYFRPASIAAALKRVRVLYPRLHLHVSVRESAFIERNDSDFDIGLSMHILDRDAGRLPDERISLIREGLFWIAHETFEAAGKSVIPLVVHRESCTLRKLITGILDRHGVAYDVAHSASGVAGLHLALEAGLGLTCLNASAIPDGMVRLADAFGLPAKPDVEFCLMPPKNGEPALVTEVRHMLAEQLT